MGTLYPDIVECKSLIKNKFSTCLVTENITNRSLLLPEEQ